MLSVADKRQSIGLNVATKTAFDLKTFTVIFKKQIIQHFSTNAITTKEHLTKLRSASNGIWFFHQKFIFPKGECFIA